MYRSLIPLVSLAAFTSCATVGGLRSEPLDQGVARAFPASFDSVMAVVPDAVEAAGLDLHESNCDDFGMCLVIGTKGWSVGLSGNLGSMARVVVEDAGDFTVVRVLSRRRAGNEEAAEDDYSAAILSQIEVRLQVAGGP